MGNHMAGRWIAVVLMALTAAACGKADAPGSAQSASSPGSAAPAPAAEDLILTVAYGSEKKSWLEEQARLF